MSGEFPSETQLVVRQRSATRLVALVPVALWAGILALALGVLFRAVDVDGTVVGVGIVDVFGVTLLGSGLLLFAIGAASRTGRIETTPSKHTGPGSAVLVGLLAFVTAGLVASQTFGLGHAGWIAVATLAGVGTGWATLAVSEDLGVTVPPGAFAAFAGVVFLSGIIGPNWAWDPAELSATFTPTTVVPVVALVAGLVTAYAGANAYAGFGARGRQAGAYFLLRVSALFMLGLLVLLVGYTVFRGHGPVLQGVEIGPGLHFQWPFVMDGYDLVLGENGVMPAIVGTFWLVVGAFLFGVPLAVGAAVFITEVVEQGRFTSVIEVATNALWSTPSIVFGLFGFAFLVPRLGNTESILAGQLVLGFMLIPLVLITSREAIKAVPDGYRDASAALGVSRWETIKSVVLPTAMPGVITGVILGIGRIAGETAPILLVTAGGVQRASAPGVLGAFEFSTAPPFVTNGALMESSTALPYQLYAIITAGVSGNEAFGWGTALVLLLLVLSFYSVGIVSRIYFRRRLER